MPWKQTVAESNYSSGRLEWVGGGDRDVYSKSGRTTRVKLRAENIEPSDDGKSVRVNIFYSVQEMASNHTHLRWRGVAILPIPLDARRHSTQVFDVREYARTWYVTGQIHEPIEIQSTAGTVVGDGSTYKIDGRGDDHYNARIDLNLQVPIWYYDRQ